MVKLHGPKAPRLSVTLVYVSHCKTVHDSGLKYQFNKKAPLNKLIERVKEKEDLKIMYNRY